MVLDGLAWTFFVALHTWLVAVSIYACGANEYKRYVCIFWLCQIASFATQVLVTGANYITPIPWMMIYTICGAAYFWLWHKTNDSNVYWIGVSMLTMSALCAVYIYLSGRHERYGDLNYVFTTCLNLLIVPQGALIFNGAKNQIRDRG